jgi:hypothetical protein
VLYGPAPGSLLSSAGNMALTTEHVVKVTGLAAGTRYHYAVGGAAGAIAGGDATHSFLTPPAVGTSKPTRIWVLGDSGTKNSAARAVRDAYAAFTGTVHTDLWLMLGDNAYPDGLDSNYQAAVFDMYPFVLRKSVLWPTLGNHDGRSADSATQSGPYYDIFTLPAAGEAGGLESGTEAYYSFDHANIHFICLDSTESSRSPTGAMLTWLGQDVASTQQDWVIAFWHHPPYSKGSHDSDTEGQLIQMRQNALPILEAAGVDLVLSGHSHSYERSFLLDGHYGASTTFSETMKVDGGNGRSDGTGPYRKASSGQAPHEGAVYVVVGSSGKVSGGLLNHPAMYISLNLLGSMVLDVNGTRLDAQFLGSDGARLEYFTIQKPPRTLPAPSNLGAAAISQSEVALAWRDNSTDEDGFRIERSLNAASWTQVTQVGRNVTGYTDVGLAPKTTYYYRVRAFRGTVNSSYSDTASATTPGAPIVQVAHDEVTVAGTRYRRFGKTLVADGVYESIEEIRTSGATALMKSYLEHKWKINVAPGSAMTFHVKGYQSPSTDNDHFVFAYSSDGSSYTDILTLSRTVDDGTYLTGALPNTLSGEIIIRVQDTDRTPGNRRIDTVFIDHLYIVTE